MVFRKRRRQRAVYEKRCGLRFSRLLAQGTWPNRDRQRKGGHPRTCCQRKIRSEYALPPFRFCLGPYALSRRAPTNIIDSPFRAAECQYRLSFSRSPSSSSRESQGFDEVQVSDNYCCMRERPSAAGYQLCTRKAIAPHSSSSTSTGT